MKKLVLITGCARSGTSMTAGVVGLCGGLGGDMFGPNKNNPKGMFENKIIREGIAKPYLRSIGADPMGQFPLPDMVLVRRDAENEEFVKRWRSIVLCALSSQIEESEAVWFYKGAKMCLFWPLWHAAFPEAHWILVQRSKSGVIRSCMRTSFMKAHRTQEGWTGWVQEHKRRFSQMKKAGLNIKEVWPEKVIAGNLLEFKEMIDWLGMDWQEDAICSFIDPHLWRSK